jgi:hypothetical protein
MSAVEGTVSLKYLQVTEAGKLLACGGLVCVNAKGLLLTGVHTVPSVLVSTTMFLIFVERL